MFWVGGWGTGLDINTAQKGGWGAAGQASEKHDTHANRGGEAKLRGEIILSEKGARRHVPQKRFLGGGVCVLQLG
jgi:hypothetical protein